MFTSSFNTITIVQTFRIMSLSPPSTPPPSASASTAFNTPPPPSASQIAAAAAATAAAAFETPPPSYEDRRAGMPPAPDRRSLPKEPLKPHRLFTPNHRRLARERVSAAPGGTLEIAPATDEPLIGEGPHLPSPPACMQTCSVKKRPRSPSRSPSRSPPVLCRAMSSARR